MRTITRSTEELAPRLRMTVMRLARRMRQQDLEANGVTITQLSALASIHHEEPIALGDLALAERVQPPTMTRIVAKLEEQGFVRRRIDLSDRRVVRVSTTAAGRRLLDDSRRRRTAYLAARIAQLDDAERAALAAAVDVIEKLLEDPS
jgi:DNA-binding MarR family transcriptional regulator